MENFLICLNAVTPIFLLMALGYLAKRQGLLDRADVSKYNKVLFRFFFPVMMFYSIYSSKLNSAVRPKLLLYGVAAVLVVTFLAWLFARHAVRQRAKRGVVIQGIYRSNVAVIGIAVVASLMPGEDLGPVAVLAAVIVPLFNVLAVIILEYYGGEQIRLKKVLLDILKNPLILGSAAGILALALGLKLPAMLETLTRQMHQATSPMLLFLLGAFFEFGGLRKSTRELVWIVIGRLVLVPAAALGLAAALGFRGVEMAALLSVFASSTAATSFTMAQQMGGDAELAGNAVVATSALCVFTMFFWSLLFKNLGLM